MSKVAALSEDLDMILQLIVAGEQAQWILFLKIWL
jgi:hypothetical protein